MRNKKKHTDQIPFKADQDYLSHLESDLMAKIRGEKYHLPLGLNHPFKAPVGYFEALEEQLLLSVKQEQKSVFTSVWKNTKAWYAAAASVLLISAFGLAGYWGFQNNQDKLANEMGAVETDEIVNYLENQSIDVNDLAFLATDDFSSFSSTSNPDDYLEEFSDEELLQLLDTPIENI